MTTDSPINQVTELTFSGKHIFARMVEGVRRFNIRERTVVVNVGAEDAHILEEPVKALRPFNSTILQDVVIDGADRLVLISVTEERNLGRILQEPGWQLYWELLTAQLGPEAAAATGYRKETPLWRSSQDTIGTVALDPRRATGRGDAPLALETFTIKVNLWFAPGGTDCAIHDIHDFIEVHTQVYGNGRMQKFREPTLSTLYQDTPMAPGYTTPETFCSVSEDGSFHYPWHQYYADNDCIWLAVEYHRA